MTPRNFNSTAQQSKESEGGASLPTLSALVELELHDMLLQEQADKPLRAGLHASSVLVPEEQWCLRRYVLFERNPERAEKPLLQSWEWKTHSIFENGWDLHQRWQQVFLNAGVAVFNRSLNDYELDLTHFNEDVQLHFSPDAIIQYAGQKYVVEIKGYKQESYQQLLVASTSPEAATKQCNLYINLLRQEGMQIAGGLVLVENKNNQDFFVRAIQYDHSMAMPYFDRLLALKAKRVTGNNLVPKRKCSSLDTPLARACPMRRTCFETKE